MEIAYFHPDIESFLLSLEERTRARVNKAIGILRIEAYHVSMPLSRKIEKGLFELRILGAENIRVFYTFYEGKIVLLHAILKKTQKLKKGDIATARARLKILHS